MMCLSSATVMGLAVWFVGTVIFGGMAYVMARQYYEHMSLDDDIEEYGGDRTKIRHEAGI
jgi:hypothetical protein